jgi:uncharacterized protein
MKIIISPSKTYSDHCHPEFPINTPQFADLTYELLGYLKSLNKDQIAKIMKLKGDLLEQAYTNIQNYENNPPNHAIYYYTGFVYKGLNLDQYHTEHFNYLEEHIRILSAFYGLLKPLDGVKPYRLDLTMKLPQIENLTHHWSPIITKQFEDDLIINLASQEFSQLIKQPMITIDFLENKKGSYKNISTYSKQARGIMLNYLIINQIKDIESIKAFNEAGYSFNEELSDTDHLVFTR